MQDSTRLNSVTTRDMNLANRIDLINFAPSPDNKNSVLLGMADRNMPKDYYQRVVNNPCHPNLL